MTDPDLLLVYVTYPDPDVARKITDQILGERLVACANILPPITSLYTWQGKQVETQEIVVLYKARADAFENLAAQITALHPYETPCIVALDITQAAAPFASWVREATS